MPQVGRLLLSALVACALLAPVAAARPAGPLDESGDLALEQGIAAEINAVRAANGLHRLRPSDQLVGAARAHAESMALMGYFSHSSPEGDSLAQRIARSYPRGRSHRWTVGETMIWSSVGMTPAQAVSMWLASPTHRRTLLTRRFRDVGVAAVHVASAPGAFGGRDVVLIVVDYGVR